MNEPKRLSARNQAIQEMLTNGKSLSNFYRFVAQNPHIDLHDACQIVITNPQAEICFSFDEWNAMGRRVTKGRKGIPYYDGEGNKYHVFDVSDTHGQTRYRRAITPVKRIMDGLDLLNDTQIADSGRGDYRIIRSGVVTYLGNNGYLTDDEKRNRQISEGVSCLLYNQTAFPKNDGIVLQGFEQDLAENAELFKNIHAFTNFLQQEIEDAITNKQSEVPVIEDIEENYVSDESATTAEKIIVEIHSARRSSYNGYTLLLRYQDITKVNSEVDVYLGKSENYDNRGNYDNTDGSLLFLSHNSKMFGLFERGANWVLSQEEMIKKGYFSEEDYKE